MAFSRIAQAGNGDVDCICQYDFVRQYSEFDTLGGTYHEGKNGNVHKTDDTPGVKCYPVLVSEYVSLFKILTCPFFLFESDTVRLRRARRRVELLKCCGPTSTSVDFEDVH